MGWAFCGQDDKGRDIGYGIVAECDFPDCGTKIDRGLGYLCGVMHGDDEGCGGYFCPEHHFKPHHNCPVPDDSEEDE